MIEKRHTPQEIEKIISVPHRPLRIAKTILPPIKDKQKGFPLGIFDHIIDVNYGCAFMRHFCNDAAELPEPEWNTGLSIINTCENSSELAHRHSAPYPAYSPDGTNDKLKRIQQSSYGPITCDYIRDNFGDHCSGCTHNVKSPAVIGNSKSIARKIRSPEIIKTVLDAVEKGDTSAHLAKEAIQAFSYLKTYDLAEFNRVREQLKSKKCPLADFDKAVNQVVKTDSGKKRKDDYLGGSSPRPPQAIYDDLIKKLEESGYHFNEPGQLCRINDAGEENIISDVIVVPQKIIERDDGVIQEVCIELYGICKEGKLLPTKIISIVDFNTMNWLVKEWGLEARIMPGFGNSNYVRDAAMVIGKDTKREIVHIHTGWKEVNGKWMYLHANGCIGDDSIRVDTDGVTKFYGLPKLNRDLRRAIKFSLRLRHIAPYSVTLFLMALVYLAPLCEAARLAEIEPEMVAWLYGRTNSRKTSLSLVFLSHFGKFTRPPSTFKDSKTAIERKGFLLKDTLMLIDDMHPGRNRIQAAELISLAGYILRIYGDRVCRDRGTPNATLRKSAPPRGLALITAEDVPPDGESDMARAIASKIINGDVNLVKLTEAQQNQDLLAEAMAGYITWLAPQMDELPQKLAQQFAQLRDELAGKDKHGRTVEAVAWLIIGLDFAMRYALANDAIDEKTATAILQKGKKEFMTLGDRQSELVMGQQPVEVFLETLQELFVSGAVYVKSKNTQVVTSKTGTHIGYSDKSYYYLFDSAYDIVNHYLGKRKQSIGASPKNLYESLYYAGHIKCDIEKQGTSEERLQFKPKVTLVNGSRARLLNLKKVSLKIDNDEECVNLEEIG